MKYLKLEISDIQEMNICEMKELNGGVVPVVVVAAGAVVGSIAIFAGLSGLTIEALKLLTGASPKW